ncbi:MAG TPA: lipid A biosynthesis acyltransferase [Thiobacillaceae bacterium]|nr:lipid A biosynthesis acyltransferase [Thiobacillaceae bacterium]HNU65409.1 lipid A biosynthesis acyltransferase [Thiobacillaceae bacterium]
MQRLGVALLWLLWRLLPARALGRLGEVLGGLLFHLARARRHIAATNLRLCFPEWDEARLTAVLKAHFRALGRASLQETVSWWGSQAEMEALTRIEGLEHITPHRGRPVICLAPHFVGVAIAGIRFAAAFSPVVTLNARIKSRQIERLVFQSRRRFGDTEVYTRQEGVKPALRALKKGRPFYFAPDLDFGRREAVFVPFFHTQAATLAALPRLSKLAGAPVVPAVARQDADGYVLRFYPAWQDYPTGDLEADVRRMNAFIEERAREMPEQYLWVHKRFKTRPEGEPGIYG